MSKLSSVVVAGLIIVLSACGNNTKGDAKIEQNKGTVNNDLEAGKISVGASEESFDLAQRLASTYVSQNTNMIVDVIPYKTGELKMALESGQVQLIVTGGHGNPYPEYTATAIACDLMVLTVNFNNPCIQYLVLKGLDLKELQGIFAGGNIINWNQIDKKTTSTPVKALVGPDSTSSNILIRTFLQSGFAKTVTSTISEKELANSMSTSPGTIAFMSHRKAYDASTGFRANGLYIIPVDMDGNNVAGDAELIFDDLNMIGKTYKKGKYPKALVRSHYFITSDKAVRSDIVKHFTEFAEKNSANVISTLGFFEPLK